MGKIDLDIQIGPDGKVTFHVRGVPGKKCLDITEDLEKDLGEVLNREYTSEYYTQEETVKKKNRLENKE